MPSAGLYDGWVVKLILWMLKNAVDLVVVWELTFFTSWWRVIRLRRLILLIFWKTADYVPQRIYCSSLLSSSFFHENIQTFPQNSFLITAKAIYALQVASGEELCKIIGTFFVLNCPRIACWSKRFIFKRCKKKLWEDEGLLQIVTIEFFLWSLEIKLISLSFRAGNFSD